MTPNIGPPDTVSRLPDGISVVIPVYNGTVAMPELTERLTSTLRSLETPFEIILVDDGSPDGSWELIKSIATSNTSVRGVCMMRNYGQHNALLAGIRAARYNKTVTMDDDLQHPPEELPKLLAKLTEGYDLIYAPPEEGRHGTIRNASSRLIKLALKAALGAQTARIASAWRLFRTELREAFATCRSPFVSIDVMLTWATSRITAQPLPHAPRRFGKSNYSFRKLVRHALTMITGFSVVPLRLASGIGFACTVFGIGILIYVLVKFFFVGSSVAGFPFLASIIAIFAGAQLFAIGVIGEYIARMHFRLLDRPPYVVRETTTSVNEPL